MIRLRRIQPGCYEVIRTVPRAPKPVRVKSPSRRQRVQAWTERLWQQYGCTVGDWAVSGMSSEERDRYISGGDRRLNKLADDNIADGLADAIIYMRCPDDIVEAVLRKFKRTYL